MLSCFCFPVQLKVGVERLTQGQEFLPRKVCGSFCCGCSYAYVLYTAGHGKECVTEIVRVESADSPLSAMAVVKTPPQGTGIMHSSLSSHVIMFLFLSLHS